VDRDPTEYTSREVLHIPGLAFAGRFGINPVRNFSEALGTIAAADEYASRFFGSGSHMGGLISVPQVLKEGEREALRQEWDQFHAGLLNAHRTGVLSKGATYTRISLDAASAQLLETRNYGIDEVSRMLRIPPHKLYDLSRATFSNIEHQAIEAVTESIRPWVVRIEAAINSDPDLVQPGHYIEASLEGLLRGDSAARVAYINGGIQGGWMTPARGARLENLPAPPELEYYQRPLNVAVIREGQPEQTGDTTSGDAPV
jgi:HK97 family phage portal protein